MVGISTYTFAHSTSSLQLCVVVTDIAATISVFTHQSPKGVVSSFLIKAKHMDGRSAETWIGTFNINSKHFLQLACVLAAKMFG